MNGGAGGPGNVRGVTLQLVAACDAALELVLDPELTRLRAEGIDDIADLELWAGERVAKITQVKSRTGHRLIGPADLADLVRRFSAVEREAEAYELVTDTIIAGTAEAAILQPAASLAAGAPISPEQRAHLEQLRLDGAEHVLARLTIRQRYGDPEHLIGGPRARALRALAGTGAPVERVIAAVDRLFAELASRAGCEDPERRFIAAHEVREILGLTGPTPRRPRSGGSPPASLQNLPARDPRLLEREDRIAAIRAGFADAGRSATQALTGLPGCGKTELAIQAAHEMAGDYRLAWWISADELSSVADAFRRLLTAAGDEAVRNADEADVLRRAAEILDGYHPWLLVLDDARTPGLVRDLGLPPGGHVLVTSRDPSWRAFGETHDVGLFTPAESVRALLSHRPGEDPEESSALAEELGHLPLALAQAGAYLELSGQSVAAFRRLLRKQMDVLDVADAVEIAEGRYERTVVATLDLLLKQLRAGPTRALVGLLAQFAPAPIPRWLLTEAAACAPPELGALLADERALDVAAGALNRAAVIRAVPDGLIMHTLTARATRERLPRAEAVAVRRVALDMLSTTFPSDALDTSGWSRSSPLLPHAHALLDTPGTLDDPDGARLAIKVCSTDHIQGRLDEAERRARRALGGAAAARDRRLQAQLKHVVGRVGLKDSRFEASIPWLVDALRDLEADGGEETLEYATIEVTLGAMLSVLEDAEAEPRLQHALAIQRRTLDPLDPRIARTLIEIGADRQAHGDIRGAEAYERDALTIVDRPGATAGVDLARGLGNLAGTLSDMPERRDEALAIAERALAVTRETYGDEHPEVAYPMTSIATLISRDDSARAFDLLLEALRLRTAAFGAQHEQVGYTLGHLGNVLLEAGEPGRALPWLEQAYQLLLDLFGDEHTEVAAVELDLARAHADLGDTERAATLVSRLLPVITDAWGARHPDVQKAQRFLDAL